MLFGVIGPCVLDLDSGRPKTELEFVMTGASRWIGMLMSGVVLISATRVVAQDWPQWRGPNRDGKVVGFAAPETWQGR